MTRDSHVDQLARPSTSEADSSSLKGGAVVVTVRANGISITRASFICLAIICNALCAGGVYSFPLISPALVLHMRFSQPQLTTIALAGMVGQYPFAAFVGNVLDRYGARVCSLAASLFFALGFGLFSYEISQTPDDMPYPSSAAFWKLSFYFGFVGLATMFSYFSIVFSATQTFPTYTGVASGTSMALFGCSPLVLSLLASNFTDPEKGLNITYFLAFLAALAGTTHLLSALCLPGPVHHVDTKETETQDHDEYMNGNTSADHDDADQHSEDEASEQRPLLSHPQDHHVHAHAYITVQEPQHGTVLDLVRDPYFWVLLAVVMIVVGECEMIMANLGSLFLSFPSPQSSSPVNVGTASSPSTLPALVQLLSLSNTLSRLVVGPIADLLSPGAAYLHFPIHGRLWSFPRKQHISRIAFLMGACVLLGVTFVWAEGGMRSRSSVWPVCLGVGIVYGTTFTILPGILTSIWGPQNLGRNFGVISYAFFFGTSLFSYLYAFVSEQHTGHGGTEDVCEGKDCANLCVGTQCWEATFAVGISMLVLAAGGAGVLWRAWRGRI